VSGRHTSAISVSALALALGGGISLLTTTAADAAVPVRDCGGGAGPLSTVTNGVCQVVAGVTGTVAGTVQDTVTPVTDSLNGTSRAPVADPPGDTVGSTVGDSVGGAVGNTVGNTVKEAAKVASTPSAVATGSPRLRSVLDQACLPLVGTCKAKGGAGPAAGGGSGGHAPQRPSGHDAGTAGTPPAPRRPAMERPSTSEGLLPADGGTPGSGASPADGLAGHARPRADPEQLRLPPLLWPGPSLPVLTEHMRAERVRPKKADDDLLGTCLTAALLLSAVLATRVVSTRRAREERPETIPLEPLRPRGRHRLA
jgi:hypothetical protein